MPKTPRSTILVVDDEPEIVELVRYNLSREGYRVLDASDGEAALERIYQSPPDLVILDLLLPKRSGIEVLEAIRNEPRTRSLPVLLLTARSTEMDKLIGFERGADDYLTKPFSPKELVARVGAVLRRTRPEEPAGEETFSTSGTSNPAGPDSIPRPGSAAALPGSPLASSAASFRT